MKIKLITGATPRDYVELIPENLAEAAGIVSIATSRFLDERDFHLSPTVGGHSGPGGTDNIQLRLYVGDPRPKGVDAEARPTIDATT